MTTFEEYDAVGRLKAVRRPDNSVVRFDYDLNGNMEILTTPSEISHEFGYSAVNRNDLYRTPISGEYVYRYDRDRRLTEMLFPSGRRIEHVYSDGRLDYTLKSGAISGWEYTKSIAFGAGVGALNTFAPGLAGGMLAGGVGAAANDLYNQSMTGNCIDKERLGKSAL